MTLPSLYACSLIARFLLSLIGPSLASEPALEMGSPDPIAECAEGTFTWQGGRPPYTLRLRVSDSNTVLIARNNLSDTVFHWVASIAAGTDLTVDLTDTGINGAGSARVSNSFTIEPGSDSCLPAASSSTAQTTTNTLGSPSSSSGAQPTPSVAPPLPSSNSAQASTQANTDTALSLSSTGGSPPRTLTGSTSSRVGPVGASTTSQPASTSVAQPSGSPDPSSSGRSKSSDGSFHPGAIASVAIGSLVAGFVLATGLFCLWRTRRALRSAAAGPGILRQRHGRLEPYDYPSADPTTRTVPASSTRLPPPERDDALDSEIGLHRPNAHQVVQEGPVKERRGGSVSPSMQRATCPRADVLAALKGAEPSRLMDTGTEGSQLGISNLVRRRWDSAGDPSDAFDEAGHGSEQSTAPPPYSQIV